MKFLDVEKVYSSDPYYDLFDGGYIKPEELLENDDDMLIVIDAMRVIKKFLSDAEEAEVLEYT